MTEQTFPSITAEASRSSQEAGVALKIQESNFEINLFISSAELGSLDGLPTWLQGSAQIGTVNGIPAYWSVEDGVLSILVGADDEVWDFGIWLKEQLLSDIRAEVSRALGADA